MNKYNQLREEIIKEVPEIMALEMNCIIKEIGTDYLFVITDIMGSGNITLRGLYSPEVVNSNLYKGKLKITTEENWFISFKIIGRDITLEDVMIAIKKETDLWHKWIDGSIQFKKSIGALIEEWFPNKPLHQQKQETIDFLYSLIVEK